MNVEADEAGDDEECEVSTATLEGRLASQLDLDAESAGAEALERAKGDREAAARRAVELRAAQEAGRRTLAAAMAGMNLTKITIRYEPSDDPEVCLGVKCAIPAKWIEQPTPCAKLVKFFAKTYNQRRRAALDPKKMRVMLSSNGAPIEDGTTIAQLLKTEGITETIYVGIPPPPDPCAHLNKAAAALIAKFNAREVDNREFTAGLADIEKQKMRIRAGLAGLEDGGGSDEDGPAEGPALPGGDEFDFDEDVL